jgi:hypothetical protein
MKVELSAMGSIQSWTNSVPSAPPAKLGSQNLNKKNKLAPESKIYASVTTVPMAISLKSLKAI